MCIELGYNMSHFVKNGDFYLACSTRQENESSWFVLMAEWVANAKGHIILLPKLAVKSELAAICITQCCWSSSVYNATSYCDLWSYLLAKDKLNELSSLTLWWGNYVCSISALHLNRPSNSYHELDRITWTILQLRMLFIAILRSLLIFILKWIFIPKPRIATPSYCSVIVVRFLCEGIGIIGRYNMEDPVCGIHIQLPSNLRIWISLLSSRYTWKP